ncbi:hypothetical protein V5799_014565 [Amblyomma americanum]|uniref:Uncharacterized protein n=1 Tax=Amblyomma americanum TaxID=6943 RepID=A0AAQ4E2M1_AMBAM
MRRTWLYPTTRDAQRVHKTRHLDNAPRIGDKGDEVCRVQDVLPRSLNSSTAPGSSVRIRHRQGPAESDLLAELWVPRLPQWRRCDAGASS